MFANGKEYAAHRGVHPSRVSQWRRQKRLVLDPEGRRIDVEASDAALKASLDQVKGARPNGNITSSVIPAATPAPIAPAPPEEKEPDTKAVPGYWEHRTRKEAADADLKQLQALERAGLLTWAAEVKKVATETARGYRNLVISIEDQMSPLLNEQQRKALRAITNRMINEFVSRLQERADSPEGADEREEALL